MFGTGLVVGQRTVSVGIQLFESCGGAGKFSLAEGTVMVGVDRFSERMGRWSAAGAATSLRRRGTAAFRRPTKFSRATALRALAAAPRAAEACLSAAAAAGTAKLTAARRARFRFIGSKLPVLVTVEFEQVPGGGGDLRGFDRIVVVHVDRREDGMRRGAESILAATGSAIRSAASALSAKASARTTEAALLLGLGTRRGEGQGEKCGSEGR